MEKIKGRNVNPDQCTISRIACMYISLKFSVLSSDVSVSLRVIVKNSKHLTRFRQKMRGTPSSAVVNGE
ncbi:CLUMA_CG012368, isoform A [Clunio marinus]|uniref:CLUMA_CG012368, isoform A n=1 Tax=Clunio marinus TaxID=568069 RepID=A0A1J1IKW0_9DIPT|nr:CLUMA_CG012368, isoform A [Clunio marinus]